MTETPPPYNGTPYVEPRTGLIDKKALPNRRAFETALNAVERWSVRYGKAGDGSYSADIDDAKRNLIALVYGEEP